MFLLVGLGMFMGTGSIQSIYTNAILGYNWKINASLSLMTMPGMVIAGFVGFHWTKHKLPIKMYIFSGFAAYVLNYVILYFMMVPDLSIDWFLLPQLLNGYGMCSLFIAIWLYGLNGIPQNDMLTSVGSVMVFRSFIATAFFSALFSWVQYALQWQSVNNLAFYFDAAIMNTYSQVGNFGQVQLGAILAANKTLLGYVIIAGLAFLTFIFFHQLGIFISSNSGYLGRALTEEETSAVATLSADALREQVGNWHIRESGEAYVLSKRANRLQVASSAARWGRKGARIVSISPGVISTPMSKKEQETSKQMAFMIQNTPVGRIGTPEDIANTVEFLISPAAGFISGTDILVDGGITTLLKGMN